MSRWQKYLRQGETLRWEGRPAPRAFTFRNWRWSAATLLLGLTALGAAALGAWVDGPVPRISTPGVLALGLLFFWGTVGHLVYARLAWERIFYALTDRRLLVKSGLFRRRVADLPREALEGVSCRPLGEDLATLALRRRDGRRPMTLFCLEHPELLLDKLPRV